jgi:hypothetical protein
VFFIAAAVSPTTLKGYRGEVPILLVAQNLTTIFPEAKVQIYSSAQFKSRIPWDHPQTVTEPGSQRSAKGRLQSYREIVFMCPENTVSGYIHP